MVQWYVFALISALFSALAAITQKKVLFKEKALVFCAVLGFFNLIIAIPFFFFIDFSILSYSGLIVLFIKSFLAAFSFLFVMLGIKNLELSRALPLLVLTPGLVAITAYIFLQEALSKMEISGIVFLTVGTYILSLKKPKKIKTPFKEAINPKGHYYIIAALIIFTITAVLDKVVLSNFKVPVNAFMGFQHLYLALIFFSMVLFTKEIKTTKIAFKRSWEWIVLIAFITMTYRYAYIQSVKIAPVALALSLKRISVFLAVIIGGKLFKEHNLLKKAIVTIILTVGAILVING